MQEQALERARQVVAGVTDPEIPTVSILDLGIVRSIDDRSGEIVVTITPTYSGCPAMQMIEDEIGRALHRAGIERFKIEKALAPTWTTAWITETGRRKLQETGIAPPGPVPLGDRTSAEPAMQRIQCPLCASTDVTLISQFGSTACKALYRCNQCLSAFDYFKPL